MEIMVNRRGGWAAVIIFSWPPTLNTSPFLSLLFPILVRFSPIKNLNDEDK